MSDVPEGIDPKILARVRGLLAKAESTTYPEEAESLSAKAIEILSRHGIDARAIPAGTEDRREMTLREFDLDGSYLPQQRDLVGKLGHALGVYVLHGVVPEEWEAYLAAVETWNASSPTQRRSMQRPKRPARRREKLHGYEIDIQRVEVLFTSLRVQSYVMLAAITEVPRYHEGNLRSYRTSHFDGWVSRVCQRVARLDEQATEEIEHSTALAVVNPLAQAEVFATSGMDKKPKVLARRTNHWDAWIDGREAAESADIGNARVEGHAEQQEMPRPKELTR